MTATQVLTEQPNPLMEAMTRLLEIKQTHQEANDPLSTRITAWIARAQTTLGTLENLATVDTVAQQLLTQLQNILLNPVDRKSPLQDPVMVRGQLWERTDLDYKLQNLGVLGQDGQAISKEDIQTHALATAMISWMKELPQTSASMALVPVTSTPQERQMMLMLTEKNSRLMVGLKTLTRELAETKAAVKESEKKHQHALAQTLERLEVQEQEKAAVIEQKVATLQTTHAATIQASDQRIAQAEKRIEVGLANQAAQQKQVDKLEATNRKNDEEMEKLQAKIRELQAREMKEVVVCSVM